MVTGKGKQELCKAMQMHTHGKNQGQQQAKKKSASSLLNFFIFFILIIGEEQSVQMW